MNGDHRMKKWILICLAQISLYACSMSNKDKETLLQAATVHNEMILEAAALEDWLNNAASDSTLTIPPDSIVTWTAALEAWEKDIVEVPGNEEHTEHDGAHHHHHHSESVDVTAEQMLTIQLHLNRRLEALQMRINMYRQ